MLLELVEKWAWDKGFYASHFKSTYEGKEDGYIHLSRRRLPGLYTAKNPRFITLWADCAWAMDGEYPDDDDQKLEPADPDFFLNLEYLIITKT